MLTNKKGLNYEEYTSNSEVEMGVQRKFWFRIPLRVHGKAMAVGKANWRIDHTLVFLYAASVGEEREVWRLDHRLIFLFIAVMEKGRLILISGVVVSGVAERSLLTWCYEGSLSDIFSSGKDDNGVAGYAVRWRDQNFEWSSLCE